MHALLPLYYLLFLDIINKFIYVQKKRLQIRALTPYSYRKKIAIVLQHMHQNFRLISNFIFIEEVNHVLEQRKSVITTSNQKTKRMQIPQVIGSRTESEQTFYSLDRQRICCFLCACNDMRRYEIEENSSKMPTIGLLRGKSGHC